MQWGIVQLAVAVYTFYYNDALLPGYTPTSETTEHIQRRALNYNYASFAKQNVFTVDRCGAHRVSLAPWMIGELMVA